MTRSMNGNNKKRITNNNNDDNNSDRILRIHGLHILLACGVCPCFVCIFCVCVYVCVCVFCTAVRLVVCSTQHKAHFLAALSLQFSIVFSLSLSLFQPCAFFFSTNRCVTREKQRKR